MSLMNQEENAHSTDQRARNRGTVEQERKIQIANEEATTTREQP
jgi:hypothetical protein